MKEETNDTATTWTPNEADMNTMHGNARLNFHADAQEAKQALDRRYARMTNHFGSYKQMPKEMKDMFKDDYAAHKAKWSDNGTEMQKRFGVKADDPATEANQLPQQTTEQAQLKQDFLQKTQSQRQQQQTKSLEYEL